MNQEETEECNLDKEDAEDHINHVNVSKTTFLQRKTKIDGEENPYVQEVI